MYRTPLALAVSLAVSTLALAGCPADDAASNPPVLWLALDGSETQTQLIDHEPKPF